ncbi:unnamed protein product [Moneuplotes crassus]|uniref:Uncharacterized protein n=1 Tax=Euplotes crassus TaxID=5936 RepID=A0AAD1Y405_EUPCR|nr:unnamed protein product [Moneuplotes crassus]
MALALMLSSHFFSGLMALADFDSAKHTFIDNVQPSESTLHYLSLVVLTIALANIVLPVSIVFIKGHSSKLLCVVMSIFVLTKSYSFHNSKRRLHWANTELDEECLCLDLLVSIGLLIYTGTGFKTVTELQG